ncbi:hypothetical protein HJC23_008808 [Cyclotella cryptica]|uniref:Small nuclear ribonucleoprotein Prp3 C-terminal domain-containing protein n=1 Tax=Cyclotella cryptica TaxID=29204 RepID=A0ABD3Q9N5_9STRA|eukprot:CCRYP_007456-RA/>CCRYP_007456-RA protein AED:0.03 eAED:0.01 QI:0/-1/0/1/-1/1/1/0/316
MHAAGGNEADEALERLVLEIDALTTILCDVNDFSGDDSVHWDSGFVVTTPDALALIREYLNSATNGSLPKLDARKFDVPSIGVEVFVGTSDKSTTADGVWLRITLPPGYPNLAPAQVTVLTTPREFPKSLLDDLSVKLTNRALELSGFETIMEVINECRDVLYDWKTSSTLEIHDNEESSTLEYSQPKSILSRRWIWVHHIKNSNRLKQIVLEARQLQLGGYLKGGYPGVVVVEGLSQNCDEFVVWIKGNKSRPGGFGRNWGHHVRGESTIEARQLPETFQELEDDMGNLGGLCRQFGVEEEFREFILQHKSSEVG